MADREKENGHGRGSPDGDPRGSPGEGPGPGSPRPEDRDDRPPEGEIRCKLERADGSEWTVTDLTLTPEGLFITAYRYVRQRGLDADSRREVLDHEPFVTTDRINCLSRRGRVRWALASPAPDGVVR
jgi:hypothetical protein